MGSCRGDPVLCVLKKRRIAPPKFEIQHAPRKCQPHDATPSAIAMPQLKLARNSRAMHWQVTIRPGVASGLRRQAPIGDASSPREGSVYFSALASKESTRGVEEV